MADDIRTYVSGNNTQCYSHLRKCDRTYISADIAQPIRTYTCVTLCPALDDIGTYNEILANKTAIPLMGLNWCYWSVSAIFNCCHFFYKSCRRSLARSSPIVVHSTPGEVCPTDGRMKVLQVCNLRWQCVRFWRDRKLLMWLPISLLRLPIGLRASWSNVWGAIWRPKNANKYNVTVNVEP